MPFKYRSMGPRLRKSAAYFRICASFPEPEGSAASMRTPCRPILRSLTLFLLLYFTNRAELPCGAWAPSHLFRLARNQFCLGLLVASSAGLAYAPFSSSKFLGLLRARTSGVNDPDSIFTKNHWHFISQSPNKFVLTSTIVMGGPPDFNSTISPTLNVLSLLICRSRYEL